MDLIEGGAEPGAHMHRRMRPNCDLCGTELKGPMPKPFWLAPSARDADEHGHPTMENSLVRVYLCREHRLALDSAITSAWERERDRNIHRRPMPTGVPSVRPVN